MGNWPWYIKTCDGAINSSPLGQVKENCFGLTLAVTVTGAGVAPGSMMLSVIHSGPIITVGAQGNLFVLTLRTSSSQLWHHPLTFRLRKTKTAKSSMQTAGISAKQSLITTVWYTSVASTLISLRLSQKTKSQGLSQNPNLEGTG